MPRASSPSVRWRVSSSGIRVQRVVARILARGQPSGIYCLIRSMRRLQQRSKSSSSAPKKQCRLFPGCRNQVKHSCTAFFSSSVRPMNFPERLLRMKPRVLASCRGARRWKFTSPTLCAKRTVPSSHCAGRKPETGRQRLSRDMASSVLSWSKGTYGQSWRVKGRNGGHGRRQMYYI